MIKPYYYDCACSRKMLLMAYTIHILYSIPDARVFYETLISSSSVRKPNVVMNPTVQVIRIRIVKKNQLFPVVQIVPTKTSLFQLTQHYQLLYLSCIGLSLTFNFGRQRICFCQLPRGGRQFQLHQQKQLKYLLNLFFPCSLE